MKEDAQSSIDNQAELTDTVVPQHTENGFGTIGGVPISQYTPPPPAPYAPLTSPESVTRQRPSTHPRVLGRTAFRSYRRARAQ